MMLLGMGYIKYYQVEKVKYSPINTEQSTCGYFFCKTSTKGIDFPSGSAMLIKISYYKNNWKVTP